MVAAGPMEITSQAAAAARDLQHIDRNGRNISPKGIINIAYKCFRDFRQRLGLSYPDLLNLVWHSAAQKRNMCHAVSCVFFHMLCFILSP